MENKKRKRVVSGLFSLDPEPSPKGRGTLLRTSPLRPHAPRWRRRFLRGAIDGVLLEHAHRFCDRAFELRIATGDDFFGPVFNIDVGRDAFIFHRPLSIARAEAATGSDR